MTMQYKIGDIVAEHDEEGYLTDISVWNKDLALLIAKTENIELTPEHWEVIDFLREYYEEYQIAPAIRVLVKEMKKKFGAERAIRNICISCSPTGQRSRPAKSADCRSRLAAYRRTFVMAGLETRPSRRTCSLSGGPLKGGHDQEREQQRQ